MINKTHLTEYNQEKYGQNSTSQILKTVFKIQ